MPLRLPGSKASVLSDLRNGGRQQWTAEVLSLMHFLSCPVYTAWPVATEYGPERPRKTQGEAEASATVPTAGHRKRQRQYEEQCAQGTAVMLTQYSKG